MRALPRLPIPGAPAPALLAAFRDALIARLRIRVAIVAAARAGASIGDDARAALLAADGELRAIRGAAAMPLDRAIDGFGLDRAAGELLELVAAPALDAGLRDQLHRLRGDDGIDLALVRDLVGAPIADAAILDLCGLGGALERAGLIETEPAGPQGWSRQIAASPRLLGLIDGVLVADARLAELASWRPCRRDDAAGVLAPDEVDALADTFAAVRATCRPALGLLVGSPGVGRARVATAIAARLGMPWAIAIDAALLPRATDELQRTLRWIDRDARFLGAMVVVRAIDAIEPARRPALAAALARLDAPALLTAEDDELGGLEPMIALRQSLRRPSAALRKDAWRAELARRDRAVDDVALDDLAQAFPLTRSAIARAVDLAAGPSELAHAARTQVRSRLERFAVRVRPRTGFSELVLADDTFEQIVELLDAMRSRPEFVRLAAGGRPVGPRGIAALFNGPPGTGKTMTANALAGELGLPLYRIDVSSIVDRYVGETEKNLARVFEEADSDRALLLFDEADSLFTKRVEVGDAQDRYANMQVNMLLNLIDDYSGFVILTTNLKASLDTAFLRRVAFKVDFELPEERERVALWELHLGEAVARASDVDLTVLAEQFRTSGGEIRNAVFRATLMAGPGQPVNAAMLRRAVALELEAGGNVVRRTSHDSFARSV